MYSAECGEGCFANARNGHSVNCQLPISPNRRSQIQMDGLRVYQDFALILSGLWCLVAADALPVGELAVAGSAMEQG